MSQHTEKTIVAAIDPSDACKSVFKEALVLASSLRAKVVLVSVTPGYEGNMNRFFIKNPEEQLSQPFKHILSEAADYASSLGLEMRTIHRSGKPSEEITAVAIEESANLILLGSAKRYQFERMLLGRVTAEIIFNAPCDVLLVPNNKEIKFNNILIGYNGSGASEAAMQRSFDIAKSYGSRVHGLYAIDMPADKSLRYGVIQDAEHKAESILKTLRMKGVEHDIPVITSFRWNSPEKCLVDYAKEHQINLIILGSSLHAGMFDLFWGSVTERVASLTPCPILVVKQAHLTHTTQEGSATCFA